MEKALFFNKENHYLPSELYFDFCGFSKTLPFHSFGPAVRDTYILHVVLEGKGTYFVNNQQFNLKKGDIFLIRPGVTTFYRADTEDPWIYGWLSFGGAVGTEVISRTAFHEDGYTMVSNWSDRYVDLILECFRYREDSIESELALTSIAYQFLKLLLEDGGKVDMGTTRQFSRLTVEAVDYIRQHYTEDLSVGEVADYLAVNRSHLSRVFKNYLNMSIQEFLIGLRINRAASLLSGTDETVESIAYQSGFNSLIVFSRMFKKSTGETPTQYRNRLNDEGIAPVSAAAIKNLLEGQNTVTRAT